MAPTITRYGRVTRLPARYRDELPTTLKLKHSCKLCAPSRPFTPADTSPRRGGIVLRGPRPDANPGYYGSSRPRLSGPSVMLRLRRNLKARRMARPEERRSVSRGRRSAMEKDAEDRVGRVKDETPERKTKLSVEELGRILFEAAQ